MYNFHRAAYGMRKDFLYRSVAYSDSVAHVVYVSSGTSAVHIAGCCLSHQVEEEAVKAKGSWQMLITEDQDYEWNSDWLNEKKKGMYTIYICVWVMSKQSPLLYAYNYTVNQDGLIRGTKITRKQSSD